MNRILIVEDEINIRNMINDLLTINQYETVMAQGAEEALNKHSKAIDLILLDLMLPKTNGKEIIKKLKEINNCPIIIVSAIGDVDMKVNTFELGADDYLTKPFQNKELLARIKLALRHNGNEKIIEYKDIKLDAEKYNATCNGKAIDFTKTEFEILKLLIINKGQIVTKSILFDDIWGTKESADENTLNVHISKIRNKLKLANEAEEYIETVWKIGYKLK